MAYFIYRYHTIVSTAVYDLGSGKWKSAAAINWHDDGNTRSPVHTMTNSPQLFSRFEDAETAGTESAQNWIDSRKRSVPFPLAAPPQLVL
jgi:hypothetical protein